MLVLGLGDTGLSVARFLFRRGAAGAGRGYPTTARRPTPSALRSELPQVHIDLRAIPAGKFRGNDMVVVQPRNSRRHALGAEGKKCRHPGHRRHRAVCPALPAQSRPRL